MIIVGDWAPGIKHVDLKLEQSIILANLEGPVLSLNHKLLPAPKAGPSIFSIYSPPADRRFIFSLANNHIMDYGVPGLETTQLLLKNRGFLTVGAGKNVLEARNPVIIKDGNKHIGIIACCEAQFGVARGSQPGVAEMGPWLYRAIEKLKHDVDAMVVSVHAALENTPWPTPRIQEFYRSLIDSGASVVHGHHAHIPQGFERYNTGVIFYGLGNFLVDPSKWRETPNTLWSLGARINFEVEPIEIHLLTFEIREIDGDTVRVENSTEEENKRHLRYIEICNNPLSNPDLLEALWQETALRAYYHYGAAYMNFTGGIYHDERRFKKYLHAFHKFFQKILNKHTTSETSGNQPTKDDYRLWYVMCVCESHRDMLATALGMLSGEIEDRRTAETRRLAYEMMPWSITNT